MMPGNQRQMKRMMKKMGMKTEEIDATRVIIETSEKNLIFEDTQVVCIDVQGQKTYQIVGTPKEEMAEGKVAIPEEDVKLVATHASVTEEEARAALEKVNGEPAEAIILLTS